MIKENMIRADRTFHWISSVEGDQEALKELQDRMQWYYGQKEGREAYQAMVEQTEGREVMPQYIYHLAPEKVLEVGCAHGRTYRQLKTLGYSGEYTGLEVADYLIKGNQEIFHDALWACGSIYSAPFPNDYFDACISVYVLEHLVYPQRALTEMMRVVKPGGRVVLMFPDFVRGGRLGSQMLGFSPVKLALEKLRRGRVVDALVSLYDSRIRLPRALRNVSKRIGPFPVNIRPLCLAFPELAEADFDAVYIASKQEIYSWALAQGASVEYPLGPDSEFAETAFMALIK